MYEKRIQMEEGQALTLVEMERDVSLVGWDEVDVLFRLRDGVEEELSVEETETGLDVSARLPCEIWLPSHVQVVVRQALANLKVKGIGSLNAEQVRGNLRLNEISEAVVAEVYGSLKANAVESLRVVGTVYGETALKAVANADVHNVRGNLVTKASKTLHVTHVSGNLTVKEMGGALDADQVEGNAVLKGVEGPVSLDKVAGNLVVMNLTGGAKVPTIGGNLVMNGELGAGCTYHFSARGNAMMRLSEGTNAHLTLSGKGKIMSSMDLVDEERGKGKLVGKLGEGGAEVVVEASGNVMLGGGDRGVTIELGEDFAWQMEEAMRAIDLEGVGRRVSEEMDEAMSRLQVKLENVDWERIGLQTQQAVERAMERMRENMDRVVEKAARHQERLERRAEKAARRLERIELRAQRAEQRRSRARVGVENWPSGDGAKAGVPEPDLDEERLSILRMVEQGQITPEEAEMLLDALQ
jgi:hypothetical protein